ncbi:hypothetical protein PENTCL1PPCAC_2847 [Pristionchus entomophagus]|uniref:Uncharacterized protein n=1 Tax=Pristionchus entomophagus TaxID=358040 RepID=A0AAV5SDR0_9BILA|nr:hypothetical protein PENTCL1PPCAC_2847 [Pristionchus entomophagus]
MEWTCDTGDANPVGTMKKAVFVSKRRRKLTSTRQNTNFFTPQKARLQTGTAAYNTAPEKPTASNGPCANHNKEGKNVFSLISSRLSVLA